MNIALILLPALFAQQPANPIQARGLWMDFGQVEVGDSDSESVDLTNSMNRPLEILDIDTSGDDAFQVDDSDCDGITLNPGDSCQIEVQFEPESAGEFSGEVEVETDQGNVEIQLEGEGVHDSN